MSIINKTVVKFGTGEISVGTGLTPAKGGFVSFDTQKARPIGSESEKQRISEVPIILEFANTESLDALIGQLKVTRKLMTGELSIDGEK